MQPLESSSSSSRVVLYLLDDSNILQIPNKYYFMMRTTLAEYSKGRRKYNENKYKWLEQIKNKQIVDKLTFLPIEFIHDREIILNAVIHESLSESMFKISDKDLLLQAVRANSHAIRFASRNLFTDREVVIQAVKQNINVLNHIPNEYRNDKNFVLDVLLTHCTEPSNINNILYFLSQQLKSDKEVVVLAVKQNGASLGCASQELRKDKQVVLQAVQHNGLALQFASLMLKDDKEVVMAAVQQNGHALQHASFTLKLDREVVQSAVRQNGAALAHALFDMTDDKDIVIEAIKQNRNAFPHASPRLKNHSEILTLVGESCSDTIEFLLLKHQSAFGALSLDNVPYPFRNDKQFILRALKNKALVAWEGIPVEIRNDREFALEAINIDGKYINYLHAFKEDPEIIMQAYQHNNSVISHFPKKIGNDREFIMKYAGVLGRDVFVLNNYMLQDKEVLLRAMKRHIDVLQMANYSLKDDKDFILQAINHVGGGVFYYISNRLQWDREIALKAAETDPHTVLRTLLNYHSNNDWRDDLLSEVKMFVLLEHGYPISDDFEQNYLTRMNHYYNGYVHSETSEFGQWVSLLHNDTFDMFF